MQDLVLDDLYIPWAQAPLSTLLALRRRGRWPQALMLHGPAGTGRRYIGRWMAAAITGIGKAACERFARAGMEADGGSAGCHPDILEVLPPPEKKIIPVDSIRSLIDFLHLRSHGAGERIVIITPAEAMNPEAANCLLKALEEPPAGASILLVVESPTQLPATIVSRCHKIRINAPAPEMTRQWLQHIEPAIDWELLLEFACGRPLPALALGRGGFADTAREHQQDLLDLQRGSASPVAVARRWKGTDLGMLLHWLYACTARAIAEASLREETATGRKTHPGVLKYPEKVLTMEAMHERLREIEDLYRNRHRSLNQELQLTALLQHWSGAGGRSAGS